MERRITAVTLAAAAGLGLVVGAVIGLEQNRPARRPPQPAAAGVSPGPAGFTFFAPTATPRPDHPSPDFGYLRGIGGRGGDGYLLFDRVTLTGSADVGYGMDNKNTLVRRRELAEQVTVLGGPVLAGSTTPREVPVSTLVTHLREKAEDRPLLVWLRYDARGRVVEVHEQGPP